MLVITIIAVSWYVAIKLTQQRIQIEGLNTLQNIKQKSSAFVWSSNNFDRDIVASFKHYWVYNSDKKVISAKAGDNPQLSLNFSSEVISSIRHNRLDIILQKPLAVKLTIQFKTEIEGEYFYYSPQIKLQKEVNHINLAAMKWQGKSNLNNATIETAWGANAQKISSLVLHFSNPDGALILENVSMPFSDLLLSKKQFQINCAGNILDELRPNIVNVNLIEVSESCYLPSNYMWLTRLVHNKYPGSILLIKGVKPWTAITQHKVNQSYANIILVNLLLYSLIAVVLFVVFSVRTKYYTFKSMDLEKAKIFDLKSMFSAYVYILVPTTLLFVFLSWQKPLNIAVFESLHVYLLWAIVQQFILGYILAERIFYPKTHSKFLASILASMVFAIMHLPSVTLFIMTFIAGMFWAYCWLKFRRIVPLALSHAILAYMFYYVTSDKVLYSAKVLQWFWE